MRRLLALVVLALLPVAALRAQTAPPPSDPVDDDVPVAQAHLVHRTRVGHRAVLAVDRFRPGGGHADWSRQGDVIVFDAPGGGGHRELSTIWPDGTHERCLTCDRWLVHAVSALDPAFHPSGQMIVFVGQSVAAERRLDPGDLATPYAGLQSELWATSRDGRDAWQLSRVGERGGQVLAPAFSSEGDRLAWSERIRRDVEPWGEWVLRVARFDVRRGIARLGDVETLKPGLPGLRLLSGFTPDDRSLLFASTPAGADGGSLEVQSTPIAAGRALPLSDDPGGRDAVARPSPRSDALVWASSRDLPAPAHLPYRSEVWVRRGVEPGGLGAAERLTYFNDAGSDHGLGEALVDDIAWGPNGDRLLVHVVWPAPELQEGLFMVLLDPERLPGGSRR